MSCSQCTVGKSVAVGTGELPLGEDEEVEDEPRATELIVGETTGDGAGEGLNETVEVMVDELRNGTVLL